MKKFRFWDVLIKGVLGIAVFVTVWNADSVICEAASGKVTANTANIRSEANADSSAIGSTKKGATIEIVGGVKDASGTVWYKVPNGNNTYGYIRSDLVETNDSIKIEEAAKPAAPAAEKPADTVPTAIDARTATVTQNTIRVRSGASTSHDAVSSLSKGDVVTLIGEATDSAGKTWYQIQAEKNGKQIEGYVRYDLIEISEVPAVEEPAEGAEGEAPGAEEPEAAPEPEEPAHTDYEVVYNDDTYWLYDNTNGTMMSVTNLLEVVNQANDNNETLQAKVKKEKIVIIIMAVVLVALIIAVTILIIKLRESYYYEYEEEEEEEEEEPVTERRTSRKRTAEEAAPERRERSERSGRTERSERSERSERGERSERSEKKSRSQEAPAAESEEKPARKTRKPQNFLVDDDEFEFEFLNMDDRDL